MNASTLLSALQWAEYTFGSVRLGDQRRTERAVEIASAIAHNPAASLPAQMQDGAGTEAAYRFLQMPDVTYEKLIGPHVTQTRAQARKQQQVLLIQDTTEVDYQQHPTTTGRPSHRQRHSSRLFVAECVGGRAPKPTGTRADASGAVSASASPQGRNARTAQAAPA